MQKNCKSAIKTALHFFTSLDISPHLVYTNPYIPHGRKEDGK